MITTTFLEMSDLSELIPPAASNTVPLRLSLKKIDTGAACASMYSAVGKSQYWNIYRWAWNANDWQRYLERPGIEAWLIEGEGRIPVGYLELKVHEDASVEVLIFGVLPEFIGHGFGGQALALAARRCLERKPSRVWLHTCSLDHPSALKNYYARGFKFVREEVTNYLVLDERPSLVEEHSYALSAAA